jgi:hypothetical protein
MGLRAGDLKDLVYNIFEIDSFKSKMGSDEDIVVMSFDVKQEEAAKDLVRFIETGFEFVLDADNTPGTIEDGNYKVFIEIDRDRHISDRIMEIVDGVSKLTGQDFKFRYHKNFKSKDVSLEEIMATVPLDPNTYTVSMMESKQTSYEEFFNKSFVEKISLIENDLIVKKVYADPVGFEVKDFGPTVNILENLQEKINMNDYAEVLFLTKYLGDYNVTKYGDKTLTLENNGYTLVVERL